MPIQVKQNQSKNLKIIYFYYESSLRLTAVIYTLFGLVEAWDGHGKAGRASPLKVMIQSGLNPAITHSDKLSLPLIITSFTSPPHPESTQALTRERKRREKTVRAKGKTIASGPISSSTQLTAYI